MSYSYLFKYIIIGDTGTYSPLIPANLQVLENLVFSFSSSTKDID